MASLCTCSSHDTSVSAKVRLLRLQKRTSERRSDERKVGTLFNRRVEELQRPTYYNQFPVCFGNDPAALLRRPAKTGFTTVNPQIILFRWLGQGRCLAHVRKLECLPCFPKTKTNLSALSQNTAKKKKKDDEHITVTKLTKYI